MEGYVNKKIGVLGGGQLGKMLCQAAHPMGIKLHVMDQSDNYPTAAVTPYFTEGNFQNYRDVVSFGRDKDILTIEIENVDTTALHYLEKNGIKIYPQPNVIDLIKDKGEQKQFYKKNQLPTSPFQLYEDDKSILKAVEKGALKLPFVQKIRTGGYDGRGVQIVRSEEDLKNIMLEPSVVENLVDIDKEIAVIVARSANGEIKTFPVVEMEFHPTANLVEILFAPSKINNEKQEEARKIATKIAEKLEIIGLLAVELFLDNEGKILINEVAPRPHNSGHQTIEANVTSQYEQHLRAILGLPLGDTEILVPAAMANLLGDPEYNGKAIYNNIENCLRLSGVHVHLYGKEITSPFRKMGHVTVVDKDLDNAIAKAKEVKNTLKIISKTK
jgi:5-(carboxyamino)imidazole ribonucleotide synthase